NILKRSRSLVVLALAVIALSSSAIETNAFAAQGEHGKKHGFSARQYEDFHDVLHPLQHDALPNKNFKEIRAKSALLTKRGRAIVRLGIPRGTSKENRSEFARELTKFSRALTKYS